MANGAHDLYLPDLVCCLLCARPFFALMFDGNYMLSILCAVNSRLVHVTIRSCTQVTEDLKSRNGGLLLALSRNGGFLLALNRNGLVPVNSSPCTLKSWHSWAAIGWHSWAAIGWHSCAFNFFVAQCLSPLSPRSSPGVISLTTPFCRLYDLLNCDPPLIGCPPGLRHPLLLQPVFQGIHFFYATSHAPKSIPMNHQSVCSLRTWLLMRFFDLTGCHCSTSGCGVSY